MTENIWFWRNNVVYLWIFIKQKIHKYVPKSNKLSAVRKIN